MRLLKLIATLILINAKLCWGQDGFRKELPYDELKLDTPFTFGPFDDYRVIDYSKDSINGKLTYSCKVNERGKPLYCFEEHKGEEITRNFFSSSFRSESFYEQDGKLHSVKSINPAFGEYEVRLYSYDKNGKMVKTELFRYSKQYELKPGLLPDTGKYYYEPITVRSGKETPSQLARTEILHDLNNFNIYYRWEQTDLWTYDYNSKGHVVKCIHKDNLNGNNAFKTLYVYDEKARIKKRSEYFADSLNTTIDYYYNKEGYISKKHWEYFYTYEWIDTVVFNERNKIISDLAYQRRTDENQTNIESIPFTFCQRTNYEYDDLGRRIKHEWETDFSRQHHERNKEVYLYKNKNIRDMQSED